MKLVANIVLLVASLAFAKHHDQESEGEVQVVVVDPTAPNTNTLGAKSVIYVPANMLYNPDPNGQRPYKNGLTMDVFVSCNNRKAFIAKRGNGIYMENYEIPAGQCKPACNCPL